MATRSRPSSRSGSREVLTVSAFARKSKKLLEASFPDVWVQGELSRVTDHGSGHAYFTLKDEGAAVSCAFFKGDRARSPAQPADGLEVLVRARATVYEPSGRFQLVVRHMEKAGEGALQKQFEMLKAALLAEGLFDESHKKPLPPLPRRVGIITSPTGAAIADIISTFRRRFPGISLRVYPVRVQGDQAAGEIVAALKLAGERDDCDALIVSRGGGSLEDLMAFNDEAVARAIFACPIPVVAGVGHEIDFSIADFVADARAPTPTAAAEMLSPDGEDLLHSIRMVQNRIAMLMTQNLQRRSQVVDLTARRLVHPARRLEQWRERLDALRRRQLASFRNNRSHLELKVSAMEQALAKHAPATRLAEVTERTRNFERRLGRAAHEQHNRRVQTLDALTGRLRAISPMATLDRGYAIVETLDGTIVTHADSRNVGDELRARLSSGRLGLTVTTVEPDNKSEK